MMAIFRVTSTFAMPSHLFVLAGAIQEGEVRAGMFIHVPFNSMLSMTMLVHGVEFVCYAGGHEDVCLTVKCENAEKLDFLTQFNIKDELLEVIDPT